MSSTIFDCVEKDPELFAINCDINTLKEVIEFSCNIYYNSSDPNQTYLSDNSYDALLYHYNKRIRNTSQIDSKIGALPNISSRDNLPFYMPSLNKIKIGKGLEDFIKTKECLVWSLKLDGISAMIVYEDNKPKYVYTRGNGVIGKNISFVLDHIDLPILNTGFSSITVRGEMIIPKHAWKEQFNKTSENDTTSRNYVSGLLNSKHISPNLKYIDFVAYDIVYFNGNVPTPQDSFSILEKLNFKVVKHGIFNDSVISSDILSLYLKYKQSERSERSEQSEQSEQSNYIIDGIVLSKNIDRILPNKLENPENTVAFKINLIEQIRETEIINVEWNISRYGKFIPVAQFKPVFIDGCRISRATLINATNCIKKLGICIGTKIKVTRSGNVIPKILSASNENEKCSFCFPGEKTTINRIPTKGTVTINDIMYNWLWKGLDIVLEIPEKCPEVHIKRHIHFFTVLNIPGIKEGMVRKMYTGGLTTIKDILNSKPSDFIKIKGIGPKLSEKFYSSIRKGICDSKLYRLMNASNCFSGGLGVSVFRSVLGSIPDILDYIVFSDNLDFNNKIIKCLNFNLMKIKGIGKVKSGLLIEGLTKFKEFIKDYPEVIDKHSKFLKELEKNGYNKSIENKSFVFTNLDDTKLEDYILDNRGTLSKVVDKDTEVVISGNISLIGSVKHMDAFKLGIKIYTVSEFIENFKVKLT